MFSFIYSLTYILHNKYPGFLKTHIIRDYILNIIEIRCIIYHIQRNTNQYLTTISIILH